jgi:hypothetical protein
VTRTPVLGAVALTIVGLLAGCAGVQPGVAARVGDETIRTSEVNRLTDGFCQAIERQLESQGTVLPMNVVSGSVVQVLAMNAAARQLAEEYDVEPSSTYVSSVADIEQSSEGMPEDAAEANVTLRTGAAYATDILTSIGRQALEEDGVQNPNSDEALKRGQDILSVWLAENEPEIDPQYHLAIVDFQPAALDTSTSYAVSGGSKAAALADLFAFTELDPQQTEEFTAYARDLPESQRCG